MSYGKRLKISKISKYNHIVSPESLIEVSEDEADQLLMIKEKWSDDKARENGAKKEESEDSLTEASSSLHEEDDDRKRQIAEEELKEETEKGPSSTPATSEWEKFDVVSTIKDFVL